LNDTALNAHTSEQWNVTCQYGITQCYVPPDTSERAPPNPSQKDWYSIYLPRKDRRLSTMTCSWLVTHARREPQRGPGNYYRGPCGGLSQRHNLIPYEPRSRHRMRRDSREKKRGQACVLTIRLGV